MAENSLQEIFRAFIEEHGNKDRIGEAISHALSEGVLDSSFIEDLIVSEKTDGFLFSHYLQKQRNLLIANCLVSLCEKREVYKSLLCQAAKELSLSSFPKEFQLAEALFSLNMYNFFKDRKIQLKAKVLSNGACPQDWQGNWPKLSLPDPIVHAELGFVWAVLGYLLNDLDLLSAASALAQWQLNYTVDHRYQPVLGLYCQEGKASKSKALCMNFLLFHAVAVFCKLPQLEEVAQKQLFHLREMKISGDVYFFAYAALLSAWMEKFTEEIQAKPVDFLPSMCDPSVAIVGKRTESTYAISTLLGSNTGLGAFAANDIAIVNFGPQRFPLGDCAGFGIEKILDLSKKDVPEAFFELGEDSFSLKGTCRLAGEKIVSKNGDRGDLFLTEHSGIWVDVIQKYVSGELSVEVFPYTLSQEEQIAFVFYVQGTSCRLKNGLKVKPRSLEQYEGRVESISLQGSTATIELDEGSQVQHMQVIPLAGDDNFWGADFLIAYTLPLKAKKFSWKIRSVFTKA